MNSEKTPDEQREIAEDWGPGSPEKWRPFGKSRFRANPDEENADGNEFELIWGEFPHSRSDSRIYAKFPDGRVEGFDGHRLLYRVTFEEYNYLKDSYFSGSEIRKGGTAHIEIDGQEIYEFFFREIESAFDEAKKYMLKLQDLPFNWADPAERQALIGRKIWYREQPAIIDRLIVQQGCMIVVPDKEAGLEKFTVPAYWDADEKDMWESEYGSDLKTEIFSPHIWWWRDK